MRIMETVVEIIVRRLVNVKDMHFCFIANRSGPMQYLSRKSCTWNVELCEGVHVFCNFGEFI